MTVLDVLGRESANTEPLKVEDSNILFGKEIVVTTTPTVEGKLISNSDSGLLNVRAH